MTRRDKDFMWLPLPGWSTWSSWYRFCGVAADRDGHAAGSPPSEND